MKRVFNILILSFLTTFIFAQDETRVIDSLESVMAKQEGREKVETMMELSKAFFEYSFDECIDWGEKAIHLSQETGDVELEADACFSLGINYGYHSDLDLAQIYLKKSLELYQQSGSEAKAFESLWNLAYFELILGNLDTACMAFQKVLSAAEQRHDSLAYAQANDNLAFIQYHRKDFDAAIKAYKSSRDMYVLLGDSLAVTHTNLNLAIILNECKKTKEARKLFAEVIPQLEAFQEIDMMLTAYKNYGMLFARDLVNYDSASYYFEKALACLESESLSRADRQTMAYSKVDLLVEMGNVAVNCHDEMTAKSHFENAFSLAEENKYHLGLMQSALSLGQLYASQGKATISMHYLEIYAKEAKQSGITMMESAVKKPLIINYARLGRFDEMASELDAFDEYRQTLQRENNDLYDQISTLQDESQGLLQQYESQSEQIETLQTQRNHYRLAFFGLLAIALFALALLIAYKIVRKKRAKV
jgi:tetratricopeptide (TPR) repeat protein